MKLIKTKDYLLLIDDEWFKGKEIKFPAIAYSSIIDETCYGIVDNLIRTPAKYFSIIAHLPLGNSKPIEGLLLLPEFDTELQQLIRGHSVIGHDRESFTEGIKVGYNKAASKGTYSLEDVFKVVEWVQSQKYPSKENIKEYLQSLSTIPTGFEPEYEDVYFSNANSSAELIAVEGLHEVTLKKFKTITTPNGEQIVGKYTY